MSTTTTKALANARVAAAEEYLVAFKGRGVVIQHTKNHWKIIDWMQHKPSANYDAINYWPGTAKWQFRGETFFGAPLDLLKFIDSRKEYTL